MKFRISTFLGILLMCSVVGWAQAGGQAGQASDTSTSSDNSAAPAASTNSNADTQNSQAAATPAQSTQTSTTDQTAPAASSTQTTTTDQSSYPSTTTTTQQSSQSTATTTTPDQSTQNTTTTTTTPDQSTQSTTTTTTSDQNSATLGTSDQAAGASPAASPATTTTTTTTVYTPHVGNMFGSGRNDLSLQVSGIFNRYSHGAFVNHLATNSAGLLVNWRNHFNHWAAGELNYGFTRNSQRYEGITTASGAFNPGAPGSVEIPANVHELSANFVAHTPLWGVQPFALIGGGMMGFSPRTSGLHWQARGMYDYGLGVDFRVYHVGLRLQARELNYKTPDFKTGNTGFGGLLINNGKWTHVFQPSAGIVFTF